MLPSVLEGPADYPLSDSNLATNPAWSSDGGTVYYNDSRRGVLMQWRVSPRGAEEVVMVTGVTRRTPG